MIRNALLAIFVHICMVTVAWGAASDWVGSFTEPSYGGNLNVCVKTVNSIDYAQGVLSELGYMRGIVSGNDIWTGVYFLAGIEAIHGNFSLQLNIATGVYSGNYTQAGSTVAYSVSGSRISSATPSDLACFNVDNSMLTGSLYSPPAFNMTSGINDPYSSWYFAAADGSVTSSYTYFYIDGTIAPGTSYGPSFLNGQVMVDNWYEPGTDQGIELIVAKNATYTYSLWWFFPSVSQFDYSLKADDFFEIVLSHKNESVSAAMAFTMSTSEICYALWKTDAEDICVANSAITDDNTNNDDDGNDGMDGGPLLATAAAFSILTFVSVLIFGVLILLKVSKVPPMAAQQARSDGTSSNL